jgi:hypothetical protein
LGCHRPSGPSRTDGKFFRRVRVAGCSALGNPRPCRPLAEKTSKIRSLSACAGDLEGAPMCPNPPVVSVFSWVLFAISLCPYPSLTSFSVSLSTVSLLETHGILPSQVAVVNLGVLSSPLMRARRRRRLPLTGEHCPVTTHPKIDWFSAAVIHLGPASCFGGEMSTARNCPAAFLAD